MIILVVEDADHWEDEELIFISTDVAKYVSPGFASTLPYRFINNTVYLVTGTSWYILQRRYE